MDGRNRFHILFELDDSVYGLFGKLDGRFSMDDSNLVMLAFFWSTLEITRRSQNLIYIDKCFESYLNINTECFLNQT